MCFSKNNRNPIKKKRLKISFLLNSKTKFLFTMALITLLAFSCSGEDGINGVQGEQGISGLDGNANVKTGVVTLTANDWLCCEHYSFNASETTSYSGVARYVNLDIPEITEDIHMYGLVLVYFTPYINNNSWASLPYSLEVLVNYKFFFESSINQTKLFHNIQPKPTNFLDDTFPVPTRQFKYIIIEGTAIGARGIKDKATDHQQNIKNKLINERVLT